MMSLAMNILHTIKITIILCDIALSWLYEKHYVDDVDAGEVCSLSSLYSDVPLSMVWLIE